MTAPPPESATQGALQFDRVDPKDPGSTAGMSCSQCRQPIGTEYFEYGGQIFCSSCRGAIALKVGSGPASARLGRAALFGLGAGIAGAILYYAIRAATGLEIGLIAIVVGWMVGRAVRIGSRAQGGRRYQILAVGLTYLAIGATYVPLALQHDSSNRDATPVATADSAHAGANAAGATTGNTPATKGDITARDFLLGIGGLLLLTIVLPIYGNLLSMPEGAIGLFLIYIALAQAWRMNRDVTIEFSGPFQTGERAAAPPG